jgi:hypothetical protein
MDANERYYWDLTGCLIVRNVLSYKEIDEVNVAHQIVKEGVQERERSGANGSSALAGSSA